MIKKIISGGQTGADQAGLHVAKKLGIETGGWAPHGWMTSEGPNKILLQGSYKLQECSGGYAARTDWNVRDSDGTIRLATNFNSPGEVCTFKAIDRYKKPHIDVDLNNPIPHQEVIDWIKWGGIEILNVAGNTQRKNFDVFSTVVEYLTLVFKQMKGE